MRACMIWAQWINTSRLSSLWLGIRKYITDSYKLICSGIVILAENMDGQERDVIEIAPKMVRDVIKLFEGDFSLMANFLEK